ncbi:MAG: phenylpyruvate tautomerase MIF-related protein [Clostridiales bacterium]|nr:phenylpyruvate tautomerase MIF-related protein [Clostridiales bacterium]
MPFINSKVTVKVTKEKEEVIKAKLGKAIELIPGKSESWLMVGFEDEYSLYFKGKASEKIAFIEVKIFGKADSSAYEKLTQAICKIYEEELQIPSDHTYITYEEVKTWGYNGFNF